jgi:hypothetical protein
LDVLLVSLALGVKIIEGHLEEKIFLTTVVDPSAPNAPIKSE